MNQKISAIDKVASGLTYLTAGWFGLIYCIILTLQKKKISNFLRYNIYQAIFIVLLFFLCCAIFGLVFNILSHIPFIQVIISWLQLILLKPILFDRSIFQLLIGAIMLYSTILSFLGKEPRIYWISNIIDKNIR